MNYEQCSSFENINDHSFKHVELCYFRKHIFSGRKSVSSVCQKNFEEEVDPRFCKDSVKPTTGEFPCNTQPCSARYFID